MSPLSVAQYLDPAHPPFDLIVFDEASQIPVWDAVGAIARGKQLVVVGDPKQLPPTSFFASADGQDDEPTGEGDIKDLESILDECLGSGLHKLSLHWHYRSRHESLITFSNVRYYDSRLITFPSPETRDSAVSFRSVAGAYDRGASRTNRGEADAIVEEISAHFLDPVRRLKSIGVVTFNQPQMTLIGSLLDTRRRENSELDRLIADRKDEALFIKNLESVQGDERDVILFSITYGPDLAGHVTMNFGPLNQEGGQRRLNVAITRARDQVIIFSTLQPDQIDAARISSAGVQDLKDYLDFAKRGPKALIGRSVPTDREPDSPFEVAVAKALRDKGWTVHPQVGCTGFRLDMGIVDPRAPGRYILGVECDGRTYHSGATARDRDRLRQLVLEGLGWKLHRIWSTDWWTDQDREIAKLHSLLEAMVAEPLAANPEVSNVPALPAVIPIELPRTAPRTAPDVAIYSASVITGGTAEAFTLTQSNNLIAAEMLRVVTEEGPIAEDELFRRTARSWNQGRTGARIVNRLQTLAPAALRFLDSDDSYFYWPPTVDPALWTGFRLCTASEDTKRHVDNVSVQELANVAAYLLDQGGSCNARSLAKSVCQAIGMARVTMDSESRASKGIESLISRGRAMRDGDRIVKC
jgi:very-short-patch-repair endonuclease